MCGSGKVPSTTFPPPNAYRQLDSAKGFLPKATKPCTQNTNKCLLMRRMARSAAQLHQVILCCCAACASSSSNSGHSPYQGDPKYKYEECAQAGPGKQSVLPTDGLSHSLRPRQQSLFGLQLQRPRRFAVRLSHVQAVPLPCTAQMTTHR